MKQNEFDNMMDNWLARRETSAARGDEKTDWAVRARITDGTRPQAFVTREEATKMLYRALEYFFQQIIHVLREDNLNL